MARSMRRRRGPLGRAHAALAVMAGRAAGAGARRLGLGAGTSLPGLVASRVDPGIMAHLGAQLKHGSALVTGTNGKTTTSGLLAYILRDAGMRVWRNREGANLVRGVTAALVIRATPRGVLRRGGNAAAVFEVDEAALPGVLSQLAPRAVVLTNLFRDQLDRYGEVDAVAERWRAALAQAPAGMALALNADDPAVAALGVEHAGTVIYFGVEDLAPHGAGAMPEDATLEASETVDVIDTRTCPRCRAPLDYPLRFYSHIGHWVCRACGFARPVPDIHARMVDAKGLERARFQMETPGGTAAVGLRLPGLYNVYNALAAAAAAHAMGAPLAALASGLERFVPAFGRAERIQADGREIVLLLAKNPTGFNEVIRALAGTPSSDAGAAQHHLLLLLNDHLADGEDVSWIWDADYERVVGLARTLVVGGTRAADLAVRLKYAGATGRTAEAMVVEPSIAQALDAALAQVPTGQTLYVVPTYTAMLAVRAEMERRGWAARYWEASES